MEERTARRVVAVLLAALVVVIIASVLVLGGRDGEPGASASPTPTASASATPTASLSPTASASASPSAPPTPVPSASAAVAPSGSPLPGTFATMTFVDLQLDATDAPGAQPKIVTFRSDGAGSITAKLASSTPQGTTHMCLQVGAKALGCKDWSSGTFTGKTSQAHANWHVTLEGNGSATPTVSLTVTFQAVAPSVKIQHARFDGTDFPDTNGIQARVTARAPGNVGLVAEWGGHPFGYEVDLFDETAGTGNQTFPSQGPSTNVSQTIPIAAAGDWRLVLQNIEGGFGVTDMAATVSWP
jgi:hypothetical protein